MSQNVQLLLLLLLLLFVLLLLLLLFTFLNLLFKIEEVSQAYLVIYLRQSRHERRKKKTRTRKLVTTVYSILRLVVVVVVVVVVYLFNPLFLYCSRVSRSGWNYVSASSSPSQFCTPTPTPSSAATPYWKHPTASLYWWCRRKNDAKESELGETEHRWTGKHCVGSGEALYSRFQVKMVLQQTDRQKSYKMEQWRETKEGWEV